MADQPKTQARPLQMREAKKCLWAKKGQKTGAGYHQPQAMCQLDCPRCGAGGVRVWLGLM